MRYVDRAAVPAPACLAAHAKAGHAWKEVSSDDRKAIRASLEILQGLRCAYCECGLSGESKRPHIEHFVQRRRAPAKTFAWDNLFWSCSHEERCGKHKDKPTTRYEDASLAKPDVDDGRQLLKFGEDGTVGPRPGLPSVARRKAETTIRVFRLDHGALRNMRKKYLSAPKHEVEDAFDAFDDPAEAADYLVQLGPEYKDFPFSSAIFDTLGVDP